MEAACPSDADISAGFDTAVIVLGRQSTEAGSYYLGTTGMSKKAAEFDEGTNVLGLAKAEKEEIRFAIEYFDNILVMLNTASAMEVPELSGEYAAMAAQSGKKLDVLWIGQPGNYGCNGIASILTGDAIPCGKLPDTYVANGYSNPAISIMVSSGSVTRATIWTLPRTAGMKCGRRGFIPVTSIMRPVMPILSAKMKQYGRQPCLPPVSPRAAANGCTRTKWYILSALACPLWKRNRR